MTEPRVPARVDRTTALTIAARIHTGRGTSPYRVVQDAEVIADYLRTGDLPEPIAIVEVPNRISDEDLATMQARLPSMRVQRVPPGSEQPWRPELEEITIRPRWWRRRPLDPVAVIGLTSCGIGIAAGLTLLAYLVTR